MDHFQIETAQNVQISQNVAGIGERIIAYLIDGCIMITYVIFVSIAISSFSGGRDVFFLITLTAGIPIFTYHLLWETFWNGRSPGKKVMKLKVVKLDGSKPSFSNYLLRWLLRIIEISLTSGGVALTTILLNGKGQRLGDMAATTTVITEKTNADISQTVLVDISENYIPVFPQVTIFSDYEMQTIKNLFLEAKKKNHHHIIIKLSEKIASVIEVSNNETPVNFIDTIIKDYNYYAQQ